MSQWEGEKCAVDAHRVCARSFLGGAPLRRSPFGRCESLERGSHYAGGGGGGGRKKGVGGTINKLYCGRYVRRTNIREKNRPGRICLHLDTSFFCIVIMRYLYLFLRHVPSHHIRTTTATATFRPPALHRRSMHVHNFFSFRPPRPILLLLPCPCTYIYFHCFFFYFLPLQLMRECTHRLHGSAHCVKTNTINILFRSSSL